MSFLSPQNIRAGKNFHSRAPGAARRAVTLYGSDALTISGPIQKNEDGCGRFSTPKRLRARGV